MTNHIEKFLREPLFWACGLVLCIPFLGSGTMLKLRNALTFDSSAGELVELEKDLITHPIDSDFASAPNARRTPLPKDAESARSMLLPPLPSDGSESGFGSNSKSVSGSDSKSASGSNSKSTLDETLPISLPNSSPTEFSPKEPSSIFASKDPEPEPPARDPGSLLDLPEYASTNEPPFPTTESEPDQADIDDSKKEDEGFDFLFGDDPEDANPAPKPDRQTEGDPTFPNEIPNENPSQLPNDLIKPPVDESGNQFVPDPMRSDPGLIQPPGMNDSYGGSQSFDMTPPQSIDQAPFGQALPAQPQSAEIFQPNPVISETPAYPGQVVTSGNVATQPQASWAAPAHVTPGYAISSGPIYQQVAPVEYVQEQTTRNWTVGLTGLFFQRDYEDNVRLATNQAGESLNTNEADEQTFDGYGINVASRNSNGRGFAASYWTLNPGSVSTGITGDIATTITGLDQLTHVPSGENLFDIYSYGVAQNITRDTDINNLEINLLQQAGSFSRWNRQGFRELFGGFRWFEFSESLQYSTFTDTATYPTLPPEFHYNLHARNRLLGLQAGVKNELALGAKLRFFSSVQGGIFNNNVRTLQNISDSFGRLVEVNAGPAAGRLFNYSDEKNDVAFLGELNFGVHLYLTSNARVKFGYRALGVSGVALAANQLPFRYDDPEELLRAKSNGNLLLNGAFYGIEFSY